MKTWTLKFASYKSPDDILHHVIDGSKTIETRPVDPSSDHNYANVKPLDTLIFVSKDTDKTVSKTVTKVVVYKSVKEMAETEDVEKIFPGIKKPEYLINLYEELKDKWGEEYRYNLERFGIVAMHFH